MNRVSIGSDNGLSPIRHQAIIWTNEYFVLYLRFEHYVHCYTTQVKTQIWETLHSPSTYNRVTESCILHDIYIPVWCNLLRDSSNSSPTNAAYKHKWIGSALVQIMVCRLFGTKPLSEPMNTLYYTCDLNIMCTVTPLKSKHKYEKHCIHQAHITELQSHAFSPWYLYSRLMQSS